jgi:hypothetical protein
MTDKKIVLVSISVIVAVGLMTLNPSMMIGNAQGQMYHSEYGYGNNYYYQDDNRYSYDKKDAMSSHVDIKKINCVNSNINVNGIDITQIPQDTNGLAAAEAENEGPDGTNTQNGDGLADRINFDRNLVNICVNVNDNEQVKVSPPEETTLSVAKTVTCTPLDTSPEAAEACQSLLNQAPPDSFTIVVTGNNPNPSEFDGSNDPVEVTLGAGNYVVKEFTGFIGTPPDVSLTQSAQFAGDCTQDNGFFNATGTIAAGESQTCDINNIFTVRGTSE